VKGKLWKWANGRGLGEGGEEWGEGRWELDCARISEGSVEKLNGSTSVTPTPCLIAHGG
jgi:hypothetical protein